MPIHIGEFLPFVFIVALIRVPLLCNMWLLLVLYLISDECQPNINTINFF